MFAVFGNSKALTALDISNNNIAQLVTPDDWSLPDGWQMITNDGGDWFAKEGTDAWTQDKPGLAPVGAVAFAAGISNCPALAILNVSNNAFCAAGGKALAEALSGQQAMTMLNIAGNSLGKEGTGEWDKPDTSGLSAFASTIPTLVKLNSLDISNNSLMLEGALLLATALKDNQTITDLNVSGNNMTHESVSGGYRPGVMTGVEALVNSVQTMGVLAAFDISSNALPDNHQVIDFKLKRHCKSKGIKWIDASCPCP